MKFKMLSQLFAAVILLASSTSFAANPECGPRDETAHNACKMVRYKQLPADLKKFMTKLKCDVKTGSNYDSGHAVDLNGDGKPEYAFCCEERSHGPCGMKVFGKTSGKWAVLYDGWLGFDDDKTGCYGFTVLKEKHAGHSDICIDGGSGGNIRFNSKEYLEVKP